MRWLLNTARLVRITSAESVCKKTFIRNKNKVRIMSAPPNTATPSTSDPNSLDLDKLRLSVSEQGDILRSLKEQNASVDEVKKATTELKLRKKALEDAKFEANKGNWDIDRKKLEDVVKRRFIYSQAFSIYGGVAGLYDFGPVGCAIKSNILNEWKSHFILEESMLEVETSMLTPEPVLKNSGHVDRFADFMAKDVNTGECLRADHLLKAHLTSLCEADDCHLDKYKEYQSVITQMDNYGQQELTELFKKYQVKNPRNGNAVSDPVPFNLMFATPIGPSAANTPGFLRPETAQGIFVNFKKLLDFNNGKLPFAAAQIGSSFRNEISPRAGLLRVREFTMAEIEHFIDPNEKTTPKFEKVKDLELTLFSKGLQMSGGSAVPVKLGDAVESGMIANNVLGYFIGRIYLFLVKIGADPSKIRFRQHMDNEMAHYACDCWDAEMNTTYGWIECVGCADRSCYDLTQHSKGTGIKMVAEKDLPAPVQKQIVEVVPNKGALGKQFKGEAKAIFTYLEALSDCDIKEIEQSLEQNGVYELKIAANDQTYQLTKDLITIEKKMKTFHIDEFTPSVIEPSFGIGRIMYAVLEHVFKIRPEDDQKRYLSLPASVAPYKCSIICISAKPEFDPFLDQIFTSLRRLNVSFKFDSGKTGIGRKYARTDEIGIPFGITLDMDTFGVKPHSVTLRERDSTKQVRINVEEVAQVVSDLSMQNCTWQDVLQKFPAFSASADSDSEQK